MIGFLGIFRNCPSHICRVNYFSTSAQNVGMQGNNGLIVRLLKMRIIKNMTKNGKYVRYSAFVAVGNGSGGVGISHRKAVNAADAISKAVKTATKSMQHFPLWQNRTIFHDDKIKWKATELIVRPAAPLSGHRCHPTITEMCRVMGIKDISAKVLGSRHPMNVGAAFINALKAQKTPEQVARDGGLKIVDVNEIYLQGCKDLTQIYRAKRYSTLDFKK